MDLKIAREIAEGLVVDLAPACEQIVIAGSLRREAAEVSDIDIVCQPKLRAPGRPEFGMPLKLLDPLEARLHELGQAGRFAVTVKNGNRLKTLYLPKPRAAIVELHIVRPPAEWGCLLTIRTGPAEFGHWLVTQASKGGGCPDHLKVSEGALWYRSSGEKIPTPTEETFFLALGEKWIFPSKREARWRRQSSGD